MEPIMDNRILVFDLYKELEFAIRRKIPDYPEGKSAIWVYSQTLPSSRAGILDQIRKYRNQNQGHGVGPACMPAPEWIPFLRKEIDAVDRSGYELTQKLQNAAKKNDKGRTGGSTSAAPAKRLPSLPTSSMNASPSVSTPKQKNAPHEAATGADGNLKVRAVLEKGEGRYTKGMIHKKSMMNFRLRISIQNRDGLKIKSITAILKGRNAMLEKKLPTSLQSVTEFDLPTDAYGGHIEASVVVDYKIGVFKSKQLKMTVSKNF